MKQKGSIDNRTQVEDISAQPSVDTNVSAAIDGKLQSDVDSNLQPAVDSKLQPAVDGKLQPAVDGKLQPTVDKNSSAVKYEKQVNEVIPAIPAITVQEAIALLKGGAKKKVAVNIAGETINDPGAALENFLAALKLAKQRVGKFLPIDSGKIYFKKMPGIEAGQATAEGVFIDPVTLKLSALQQGMLIGHEFGHQFGEIQNEGMIQALVESAFDQKDTKHTYQTEVANFNKFAEIFDRGFWRKQGDGTRATTKIYNLYCKGRFEEIYDRFEKNYVRALRKAKKIKRKEAQLEAKKYFEKIFPELEYTQEAIADTYEFKSGVSNVLPFDPDSVRKKTRAAAHRASEPHSDIPAHTTHIPADDSDAQQAA